MGRAVRDEAVPAAWSPRQPQAPGAASGRGRSGSAAAAEAVARESCVRAPERALRRCGALRARSRCCGPGARSVLRGAERSAAFGGVRSSQLGNPGSSGKLLAAPSGGKCGCAFPSVAEDGGLKGCAGTLKPLKLCFLGELVKNCR